MNPPARSSRPAPPEGSQARAASSPSGSAAQPPPSSPSSSATGSPAVPGATSPRGRVGNYEILSELGRGGMGVVYKARDLRLKRVVALKMLLGGGHASVEGRVRFGIEAEAVARLAHPGIVSVYEIGEQDGLPFFALEFCGGGSLAARIAGKPQNPRQAAATGAAVARAMQAAHEAGIVHRDLKPANVLFDEAGRPKVADFGLAKRMDSDGGDPTRSGAALGTLAYMAPEQMADARRAGPAADVYALGAILYEMVTGRPPFLAESDLHLVYLVTSQEPVSLRQLQPKAPADLETIAAKCLAKEPNRRYASMAALAGDLERFLRGEPIRARPAGTLERSLRWARRNPAVAALSGTLAAAVALGLAGVTWKWREAETLRRAAEGNLAEADRQRGLAERNLEEARTQRTVADAAREEAETHRRAAEENLAEAVRQKGEADRQRDAARGAFLKARAAVDEYLTRVSESRLLRVPGLQPLRKELLEAALRYYKGFLADAAGDPSVKAELADAISRVALVTHEIGSRGDAVEDVRRSIRLFRELADDRPDDPSLRRRLAELYANLGGFLVETGKAAECLEACRKGIEIAERLAAADPSDRALRVKLVDYRSNLSHHLRFFFRVEEGLREAEAAVALGEALLRERPDDRAAGKSLSSALLNMANLHIEAGRPAEAGRRLGEARGLLERLSAADPADPDFREALSKVLNNLANLAFAARPDEALRLMEGAVAIRERLHRENPAVTDHTRGLADGLCGLASQFRAAGRDDDAVARLERAAELYSRVAAENPTVGDNVAGRAMALFQIAEVRSGQARHDEALRFYREAVGIMGKVAADFPEDPGYLNLLGAMRGAEARALEKAGRPDEAAKATAAAVDALREAVRRSPEARSARSNLIYQLLELARKSLDAGKPDAAVPLLEEVRGLKPNEPYQWQRMASALALLPSPDAADRAMDALREGVKAGLTRESLVAGAPESLKGRPDFAALAASARPAPAPSPPGAERSPSK